MSGTTHACRICRALALKELDNYRALPRVTSDAKPWPAGGRLTICDACGAIQKVADAKWCEEIGRIYAQYEIYHQAGGSEQQVYDTSDPTGIPRSLRLVKHMTETLHLPERGSILDFGCGNGMALRNFAVARPAWTLYGSELSDRDVSNLRQIPGFAKLYTCPVDEISEHFTLVTLIHVLEHVLDPVDTLALVRGRIEEGGDVFVEVPDAGVSPYDLIVADHQLHFTFDSLRLTAQHAGYGQVLVSSSVVNKELTLVGKPNLSVRSPAVPDPRAARDVVGRHLAWLECQVAAAKELAADSPRFGIFGTSISGTWLGGILSRQVAFFVDEDRSRVNRTHLGKPIFGPADIPLDSDVFVPLITDIASAVVRRLAHPAVRFHSPPPW